MGGTDRFLSVEGLGAAWEGRPVLEGVSFSLRSGELLALLGPNGSGKTTLLRCLAGLERPTAGRVLLEGRDLAGVPPHRRGIVIMFQDAALFPHRTVFENVAYAPMLQRRPRPEVDRTVEAQIALVGLTGLADRPADRLSGGERQRVALARSLAANPRLILFDEPFASIDPEGKAALRAEFRRVLRAAGATGIHVTHDRAEGLFLGDRVGLLFAGRLDRVDRPERLYGAPGSERAARFLGYNVLVGPKGAEGVDPRDLVLSPEGTGKVQLTVVAGGRVAGETWVSLRDASGGLVEARGPIDRPVPTPGETVGATWDRAVRWSDGAKDDKNAGALDTP